LLLQASHCVRSVLAKRAGDSFQLNNARLQVALLLESAGGSFFQGGMFFGQLCKARSQIGF
jgi:hypothetical protein